MVRPPLSDCHVLNIGEVHYTDQDQIISCLGLGSCIGLFLYDRVKKIGGGAHIFLPTDSGKNSDDLKYDTFSAIEHLIKGLTNLGADIHALRAKIVGGGKVYPGKTMDVGKKNLESVRREIMQRKIYVANEVVGENRSRTAHFYVKNGSVMVHDDTGLVSKI